MTERILAIRLRALGDVVLVTPALRALANAFPGCELEVVTDIRYVALLEGAPGVSRVWGLERSWSATLGLIAALRSRGYRIAVDFFGNPRSALVTRACGAPATAGFDLRGRRGAYRLRVARDAPGPGGAREHASAAHLRLASAVGGKPDGESPRIRVGEPARALAARRLDEAGVARPERTIGLVAAGSWATKTWPLSHTARLARLLAERGHDLLLIAGPGEERVTRAMRSLAPELAVLPACDVATLAAVIARLKAVVGTDSGPRHLAAALDVPTYAWFGPTHPESWQPPGPRHGFWQTDLPCRGCDLTSCPHWNCLPGLTPERAAAGVIEHLESQVGDTAGLGSAAGA